jgi:translation elongation factor EF-G
MQPIDAKSYAIATKRSDINENDKKLIGFGRIFSGTIKSGDEVYVLGATHSEEHKDITKIAINEIFILMGGNNLKLVEEMKAGNIVGIGGLENVLLKMGTISSSPECPSFAPAKLLGTDLIKVAIQPKNLSEMPILIDGLKKLDKADPSVSYCINDENGEYILQTCGQLHLERCVKDLNDDFAQIEIEISEPIVSFKETIIKRNLRKEDDFEDSFEEIEWFEEKEEEELSDSDEGENDDKSTSKKSKPSRHNFSDSEEDKLHEEEKSVNLYLSNYLYTKIKRLLSNLFIVSDHRRFCNQRHIHREGDVNENPKTSPDVEENPGLCG